MTANELNKLFMETSYPKTYQVNAETYGNVCQFIFDNKGNQKDEQGILFIVTGPHNGIMFKNVELILVGTK